MVNGLDDLYAPIQFLLVLQSAALEKRYFSRVPGLMKLLVKIIPEKLLKFANLVPKVWTLAGNYMVTKSQFGASNICSEDLSEVRGTTEQTGFSKFFNKVFSISPGLTFL